MENVNKIKPGQENVCCTGDFNVGADNSGNCNVGNQNTGNCNVGWRNTSHCNHGYYNTGDYNIGSRNSGHYNIGWRNTGDYNLGNYNSGLFNKGNNLSGIFCTKQPVYIFNKICNEDIDIDKIKDRLSKIKIGSPTRWIKLSDLETVSNDALITKGKLDFNEVFDYSELSEDDKNFIKSLPNYDDKLFFEITGISLDKD